MTFSLLILIIVKEPKIERSYEKNGFIKQTYSLSKLTFKACQNDKNLFIALIIALMISNDSLIGTFIMSFIDSF